jgi:hypothetical protein
LLFTKTMTAVVAGLLILLLAGFIVYFVRKRQMHTLTTPQIGALGGIGLLILGGLIALFFPHAGKDTPIVIVGGCIHGDYVVPWTEVPNQEIYYAPTQHSYMIYVSSVYANGSALTQPVTATGGWVLAIYDQDSYGADRPNPGIMLCTDQACKGKGDGNTVYIEARQDNYTNFEVANNGLELRFHNRILGCDDSRHPIGYESSCDHIKNMKFRDLSAGTETVWQCGQGSTGVCTISVGALPPASLSSARH